MIFWCLNVTFNNISAISWRPVLMVSGSRSTRREPSTLGKQLVSLLSCGYLVFFFKSYYFYTSIKCMLPGMLWTLLSALVPLSMSYMPLFALPTNQEVIPIKLTHHKQAFLGWFLLHSLKVVLFITHWKCKITKKRK